MKQQILLPYINSRWKHGILNHVECDRKRVKRKHKNFRWRLHFWRIEKFAKCVRPFYSHDCGDKIWFFCFLLLKTVSNVAATPTRKNETNNTANIWKSIYRLLRYLFIFQPNKRFARLSILSIKMTYSVNRNYRRLYINSNQLPNSGWSTI